MFFYHLVQANSFSPEWSKLQHSFFITKFQHFLVAWCTTLHWSRDFSPALVCNAGVSDSLDPVHGPVSSGPQVIVGRGITMWDKQGQVCQLSQGHGVSCTLVTPLGRRGWAIAVLTPMSPATICSDLTFEKDCEKPCNLDSPHKEPHNLDLACKEHYGPDLAQGLGQVRGEFDTPI